MREVDLVDDGDEREALGECEVEVGYRLSLYALAGIDEKQSWVIRELHTEQNGAAPTYLRHSWHNSGTLLP
jgi:hypothetical protein